ncbi:type VII toxin-antitoxin system HepT family RNase toxin [Desulfofalx alkaliphila]|uniref:type VII toxin-antitoxin system HepT family RNase toxin n=1 Tax=Desulfofalx alkaliphila TaxID=105483 RepID=UPI0004E27E5F|nr:DUF86 domain-containing protein [Desulfofalx alkaliphila]
MKININMLQHKSADIVKAKNILEQYGSLTLGNFLADETVVSAAKYQLIVAIEAAQNICNHLVARLARRAPVSYSDCYVILRDEGLIDEQLAESLSKMAKFRNLLVHRYGNIDDEIVYDIIKSGNLNNLTTFLSLVNKLVEKGY